MPTQIPQPPTTDKSKKGQEQEQKPGQSKPNQQTQGDKSQQKPQNPANPIERDTQFDKGQKQDVQGQKQGENFEPYDARRKTQPIEDVDFGGVDGKENMSEQPGAFRTAGTQGPGNSKIDRNTMSDQPGALRNKDTE